MIISVIILVYHNEFYLNKCVDSILKSAKYANLKVQLIVVVNDLSSHLKKANLHDNQIIINNESNLGFGKSINNAAKKAKGEWLLFANADTITQVDTFSKLRAGYTNSAIGVITPKIVYPNRTFQPSILPTLSIKNILLEQLYLYKLFPNLFKHPYSCKKAYESTHLVDSVSACYILIRKETFEKVGGFDTRFFLYFEDFDLCHRILKTGKKILFVSGTKIIHYGHRSNSGVIDGNEYVNSFYKFLTKYRKKPVVYLSLILLYIGSLSRSIVWKMKYYLSDSQNEKIEDYKKYRQYLTIYTRVFELLTGKKTL